MSKDELNNREETIALEGFMMGRIYTAMGEKEDVTAMYKQVLESCARAAEAHPRTAPTTGYREALEKIGSKAKALLALAKATGSRYDIATLTDIVEIAALKDAPSGDGLRKKMAKIVEEHPLTCEFETDARTIWPVRWAALSPKDKEVRA